MPSERERNRARFPFAAYILDELRPVFGADVRLMHATTETDEIGERQPVGVVATQPARTPEIQAARDRAAKALRKLRR